MVQLSGSISSIFLFTGFTKLRVLNIGKNDIGDEGMGMILETLQDNKSLTELNIEKCGLSSKGTYQCVSIQLVGCMLIHSGG